MNNGLTSYLESSKNSLAKELLQNLEHVRQYARPILTAIEKEAGDREDRYHQPVRHAEEVGNLCFRLLPEYWLSPKENYLNAAEATILLAGAWLHEIGLIDPGSEDTYSLHSARMVWDKDLGTTRIPGLDSGLAPIISEICCAHRDYARVGGEVVSTLKPGPNDQYWKGLRIRMSVLAALLRTAFLLEVHHHRRSTDMGARVSPEGLKSFWVKEGPISALDIVPERGLITVQLSERAQSSEMLRHCVELWCEKVNREFSHRAMEILAAEKLAYHEKIVNLSPTEAVEESSEARRARALEQFRRDAERVVALKNELGVWELRTGREGFPILRRTLIDPSGRSIELQIIPGTSYPDEPPVAKAHPRIGQLEFRETGCYEGSAVLQWKEAISRGNALIELCEALRRFESAERAFATHAKLATQDVRFIMWTYSDGKGATPGRLTRKIITSEKMYTLNLRFHHSYPLWLPEVEGLKELEAIAGIAFCTPKDLVSRWQSFMIQSDNPLKTLMDWFDQRINEIISSLRA